MFFGKLTKLTIYALDGDTVNSINSSIDSIDKKSGSGVLDKLSKAGAIPGVGALNALDSLAGSVVDNVKNIKGVTPIAGTVKGYEVMFNPESYSTKYAVNLKEQKADGNSLADLQYASAQPQTYSFDLYVDATGATGQRRSVTQDVKVLKELTGYDSEKHEPRRLLIVWGELTSVCVLSEATFNYELFDSQGVPLRVKISATFSESIARDQIKKLQSPQSPDLTKVRTVKAGQTLPLLCEIEYGSPDLYMEVARVNNLTNFRNLELGQRIVFPPIEK